MLCNYIKAEQARVQEHAEPSTLCTVEFRCPQCQPRQAIDADDAEDSMDEDVNADGLNRQEAFSAEDDDRAQDAHTSSPPTTNYGTDAAHVTQSQFTKKDGGVQSTKQ